LFRALETTGEEETVNRQKLLIVDDRTEDRNLPAEVLESRWRVRAVETGGQAMACLQQEHFAALIVAVDMPGITGRRLIAEINEMGLDAAVLAITDCEQAGAMEEVKMLGADDFIARHFVAEQLLYRVDKAVQFARLRWENRVLQMQRREAASPGRLLGRSESIRKIKERIRLAAPTKAAVLISGESGTGKKLIAGEIHRMSDRRNEPLVTINCASIPEDLLEDQMFGHEAGSFPGSEEARFGKFELADRGTVLLEEVGAMSGSAQAKLLRVLQDGEFDRIGGRTPVRVDVRVIATTTRNMEEEIDAGNFREDLFYRLNVIPIETPPLRDRRDDIPLLLDHCLRRYAELHGKKRVELSPETMRKLCNANWKGNVRELENQIERAVIMGNGEILEENLFEIEKGDGVRSALIRRVFRNGTIHDMEKLMILSRLDDMNNNRTHAAKSLDISVRTLRNKLHEYNAERKLAVPANPKKETEEEPVLIPG